MRMHGPYISVSTAVTTGLLACAAPTIEEALERSLALREIEPQFRERYLKVGQWLVANVPYLSIILPMLEEDPSMLMLFGRFVDYHARAARTADISTLKQQLPQWVANVELQLAERETHMLISPRVNGIFDKNKANYGWNSLCQAELRAGLRMTHHYFPSFVYAETDEPVESEEDCHPFLLTGDLLTKASTHHAYRAIWTSPESSTKEPGMAGTGRASISRINSINNVYGENIAYVASLLRHILSSETTWAMQDPKAFDGAGFWAKIVELLKNDEALAERVFRHFH
ncbi:hypothetical protein C8Q78DRAFT_985118 [Trametes maxima]|nr:hypothetical protein C8Q78DRAFT_985118 [Trametes maxima]